MSEYMSAYPHHHHYHHPDHQLKSSGTKSENSKQLKTSPFCIIYFWCLVDSIAFPKHLLPSSWRFSSIKYLNIFLQSGIGQLKASFVTAELQMNYFWMKNGSFVYHCYAHKVTNCIKIHQIWQVSFSWLLSLYTHY